LRQFLEKLAIDQSADSAWCFGRPTVILAIDWSNEELQRQLHNADDDTSPGPGLLLVTEQLVDPAYTNSYLPKSSDIAFNISRQSLILGIS
jgi:hypothetical protein